MRSRIEVRNATATEVEEFYGHKPRFTMRALLIVRDGQPEAVLGISREGRYQKIFSDVRPALVPYLKSMAVLRAIKAAMRLVAESRLPVLAVARNEKLLERLGFERVEGDTYQWAG